MAKHLTILVKGKVQGVFFRASTKEKADQLKIVGTVRNQADGSVFIEAEGSDQSMIEFVNWCRRGPTHARVDEIHVNEVSARNFDSFQVIR
jgi:acylphosphatase